MKITPAHDFNDFEVGKRHDLPLVNVLDVEGKLALKDNEAFLDGVPASADLDETMTLHGIDRFKARKTSSSGWRRRACSTRSSRTRTWCRMATAPTW